MIVSRPKIAPQVWAALVFVAIVFVINRHWFRAPIVELSDFAANSLQVYHARLFRELMGNYSRWEFHHPGPFFFYVLAGGERVFHDWLGIAPGTFNAQLLTIVIVNAAFLFGAIEIFAAHFTGRLFRPLALAAAVLWMCTVNQTAPASAMVSLWMPHVALLAFLFFAAACASVAAGKIAHLPWMVLGAMVMVHLHVAQILFAGTMSLAACVSLAVRRTPLAGHWKTIAASLGIVALFLLPVALELAVDHPNNLDDIRAYLARYPDPHLGMAIAVRYYLSFLAFLPDSTVVMGGGPRLIGRVLSTPYVAIYWAIYLAALLAAVAGRKAPRFVWMVAGECLLVSVLFLVLANRITGDL